MSKYTWLLLLLYVPVILFSQNDASKLYPIQQGNLWGYIDGKGEVKIEPKYKSVGDFSEGLAAVRLGAMFGYITVSGEFVIAPAYDYAYSFENEIARVYIDAKPFYIDKEGKLLFEHSFKEIVDFEDCHRARCLTYSNKWGVIDRTGKLVIDTVYKEIDKFSEGIATVKLQPKGSKEMCGLIDLNGRLILKPRNDIWWISKFRAGYAHCEFTNNEEYGIVDADGRISKLKLDTALNIYQIFDFSDGLALIDFSGNKYSAVIDTNGDVQFTNKDWEYIHYYRDNVSFARDSSKSWTLINKKGESINGDKYLDFLIVGEENKAFNKPAGKGFALVHLQNGWTMIDKRGKQLLPLQKIPESDNYYLLDSIMVFAQNIPIIDDLVGFWNVNNGVVVEAKFSTVRRVGDLFRATIGDTLLYLDRNGSIIWKQQEISSPSVLNIDYKNNCFYLATRYAKEEAKLLENPTSYDLFAKRIGSDFKYNTDSLLFVVDTNSLVYSWDSTVGMQMYIANMGIDTLKVFLDDGCFQVIMQAKDKYENWQDIEYFIGFNCEYGDGYKKIHPKRYWQFVAQKYEGGFKTRMRAKWKIDYKTSIYSNEFSGSINPAQFWRLEDYDPKVFDSYLQWLY